MCRGRELRPAVLAGIALPFLLAGCIDFGGFVGPSSQPDECVPDIHWQDLPNGWPAHCAAVQQRFVVQGPPADLQCRAFDRWHFDVGVHITLAADTPVSTDTFVAYMGVRELPEYQADVYPLYALRLTAEGWLPAEDTFTHKTTLWGLPSWGTHVFRFPGGEAEVVIPRGVAIDECAAQASLEIPAAVAEPVTDFAEPETDFVESVTDPRGRLHVDQFITLYDDYVAHGDERDFGYIWFVGDAYSTVGYDIDYYPPPNPDGSAGQPAFPSYREVWDSTFFYVPGTTSPTANGPLHWRFYSISDIHRATDGELTAPFPYLAWPSMYVINNLCFGPWPARYEDVEWARHVTAAEPTRSWRQNIVLESIGFSSSCEEIFGSPLPLR